MSLQTQRTYTCRCSKRHLIPAIGNKLKCGCGRIGTVDHAGKVFIQDKVKK